MPTFKSARFDEVQKYLSQTQIVYDPLVVLFSKKNWDKLNADEQKILVDSAKEATQYQRKLNRETISSVVNGSRSGFTVTQMSPEERQRMREHLKPVIDRYSKDLDQDLLKEFWAEVAKAQGK